MRRGRFVTLAAVTAVLALTTLTGAAAAPAVETTRVAAVVKSSIWDPESILDLLNYRSTISGTQLSGSGGFIERNAWTAQNGRLAAQNASIYNTRMVYGMEKFADPSPIRPYPPNTPLVPKVWNKFSKPTYGGLGLKAGAGPLTAALIAWEFRGTMTDGALSLIGLDPANDQVCGSRSGNDGADGFVSWLTGQDCGLYDYNETYNMNAGIDAGYASKDICKTTSGGTACVRITGISEHNGVPTTCMQYSGTNPVAYPPTFVKLANGTVQSFSGGSSPWRQGSYPNSSCMPFPYSSDPNAPWTTARKGLAHWVTGNNTPYSTIAGITYGIANGTYETVAAIDTDPERTMFCQLTGSDGRVYVGNTAPFRFSETSALPTPNCGAVPSGVSTTHLKIWLLTSDGTSQILVDQDSLPMPLTEMPDRTSKPLDTLLGAPQTEHCKTNVCILDLVIKDKNLTCFSQAETCDGWWEDSNRETKYECQYGGHAVSIRECAMYAHIFNTQKRLAGNPYADPVTGEDTGLSTGASIDRQMMGSIPRASFQGRDCFGAGYGDANPLQWVLKPLQCFGEWAAIPRESVVQTAVVKADTAWDKTMFGKIPALVAPFQSIPTWSGCAGIPIDIEQTWPIKWGIHWTFGAACTGPTATAAGVVRLVVGGLLGGAAILALTDYLGFSIGFRGFGRRSDLS